MKKRLDLLRAALWKAIALTLAETRDQEERDKIIQVAQNTERTLELSFELFS